MSRAYKLYVEAIGISKEQLNKVVNERFGWEGETQECGVVSFFCGDGCLCGGTSEEEAHCQIYAALKEINPNAKIKTEWLCVEEQPYNWYGDKVD